MPESEAQIYLHFVWATKYREPVITLDVERDLYRVISAEATKWKCETLAIGGMPDHLHLLVRFCRTYTVARLMNQVKGASSRFLSDALYANEEQLFRWQPGYGVFSVSPNHINTVIAYIRNQKQHHADGKTHDAWEKTGNDKTPTKIN